MCTLIKLAERSRTITIRTQRNSFAGLRKIIVIIITQWSIFESRPDVRSPFICFSVPSPDLQRLRKEKKNKNMIYYLAAQRNTQRERERGRKRGIGRERKPETDMERDGDKDRDRKKTMRKIVNYKLLVHQYFCTF